MYHHTPRRSQVRNFFSFLLTLIVLTACVLPVSVTPTPVTEAVPTYTPTVTAEQAAPAVPSTAAEATSIPPALTVALDKTLPERYAARLLPALLQLETTETNESPRVRLLDRPDQAEAWLTLVPLAQSAAPARLTERFYAPVVPFATVQDATTMDELAARWRGEGDGPLVVMEDDLPELRALFGDARSDSVIVRNDDHLQTLEATPGAIGILAFPDLTPRYKVLSVDGANVLDNQLDAESYPLAVALTVQGQGEESLLAALRPYLPEPTNRDPSRLTSLIMTGVTAMSRVTAARMEQKGYTYPAEIISDTLRAADITHISNEVPFLDDCVVNAGVNNLILCSHTNYWAALEALGTDIVGLSGNHVNDFGRDGARRSLTWYEENEIPIYGSGMNVEDACAPLQWEHNGNTFAFFAALAFFPESAWATEDQPGACYYFDNKDRILAQIEELRDEVDVIAVELQHTETYNPFLIAEQIADFRELHEAGVDIVTGVQSHVPQAMEPYSDSIIVYGLGNLFFDQMWSWETRTELIARHTIYDGELISTEILTAVLEDYAQPRWATPEERTEILQRIFNAAPPRPSQ